MQYLLCYLAGMTVIGFAVMGIDKFLAIRHARRIPEKTLFWISALGGSLGTLLGMYTFRHKTRHRSFVIGMPSILIAHIGIAVAYLILS